MAISRRRTKLAALWTDKNHQKNPRPELSWTQILLGSNRCNKLCFFEKISEIFNENYWLEITHSKSKSDALSTLDESILNSQMSVKSVPTRSRGTAPRNKELKQNGSQNGLHPDVMATEDKKPILWYLSPNPLTTKTFRRFSNTLVFEKNAEVCYVIKTLKYELNASPPAKSFPKKPPWSMQEDTPVSRGSAI